jgi:hypothetical protein
VPPGADAELRPALDGGPQLAGAHDLVDDPDLVGAARVEGLAGEEVLQRVAWVQPLGIEEVARRFGQLEAGQSALARAPQPVSVGPIHLHSALPRRLVRDGGHRDLETFSATIQAVLA